MYLKILVFSLITVFTHSSYAKGESICEIGGITRKAPGFFNSDAKIFRYKKVKTNISLGDCVEFVNEQFKTVLEWEWPGGPEAGESGTITIEYIYNYERYNGVLSETKGQLKKRYHYNGDSFLEG